MEWTDQGIVLSVRRHGEASSIVELLTCQHGRHLGLVRGGASARMRSVLQTGNSLDVTWRARLADHLGTFVAEATATRAAMLIEKRKTLAGLQSLAALSHLLPEREPVPQVHEALQIVLDTMVKDGEWLALMVRFELGLLSELGFGLDLSACAATGCADDLAYVSPKSGRAVSRTAGTPYHNRLLPLPGFLIGRADGVTGSDVLDGLKLTGYFLERDVFGPRGIPAPEARARLIAQLMR